jgi:hypothetical protein
MARRLATHNALFRQMKTIGLEAECGKPRCALQRIGHERTSKIRPQAFWEDLPIKQIYASLARRIHASPR